MSTLLERNKRLCKEQHMINLAYSWERQNPQEPHAKNHGKKIAKDVKNWSDAELDNLIDEYEFFL